LIYKEGAKERGGERREKVRVKNIREMEGKKEEERMKGQRERARKKPIK
jgi:hypothetical protein